MNGEGGDRADLKSTTSGGFRHLWESIHSQEHILPSTPGTYVMSSSQGAKGEWEERHVNEDQEKEASGSSPRTLCRYQPTKLGKETKPW